MIAEWQSAVLGADMADWVTVAAYLLAAVLAGRAARFAWSKGEGGERLFWWFTALLLVFLGVNELLDLQALLTAAGRTLANEGGWFERRREVQFLFVVALAVAAAVIGLATIWLTRRMHRAVPLALIGLGSIGLFILLRAGSIHHLDEWLGSGWKQFNYSSIQEMAGILIVGLAAVLYLRQPPEGR